MTPLAAEPDRHELRETPRYLFSVSRRQFLGFTAAGLLVLAWEDGATAQSGEGASLQARLHLGEDGRITILNGKVEEGQGARTEIAMAAAEELGVPVTQIDVVMADTGITPSDGTTAGSRTTPATIPLVRRAAAAARQLLASQDPDGARKLTYRDLAKSPELAKAYTQPVSGSAALTAAADFKTLGRPQVRVNSKDIVTGAHQFPSDIQRPGMVYGCVLRPPSVGASLSAIDLAPAQAMKDVVAVRDGDYVAFAAPTSYLARKAASVVAPTAQWKEKTHPSSDALYDHLKSTAQEGGRNRPQAKGDVEAALGASKTRRKAAYTTAYVQHAPMEPRAAVAEWTDGKVTVWTGTSNPFSVRDELARAFGIPAAKVRVIVPDMGGGFGGKHTGEAAVEAARLAKAASRPVWLRWTRAEEFMWAYARPAALIEIEAGLDADNAIAAWDFVNYNAGTAAIDTPYRAASSRIRYLPCDSPLRQGSYRALASTANNFAREAFTDELAAAAGMEPLAFRLAHLDNDRIREVLLAATAKFRWAERSKLRQPGRGVGLACGTEKNSVVAACVEVEIDAKTGAPRLVEICQAFECGTILNPLNLAAQIEGCIIMGLGAILREELLFENGRLKNGRFSAYRVPRFRDTPKIDVVLVNKRDAEPIGAGETPLIAVAPAMANAVFNATGQRVRSLPFRLPGAKS